MTNNLNVLVTGGAGFIGSNAAERLLEENNVTVIDNLSNVPDDRHIRKFKNKKNFKFLKKDITNSKTFESLGNFDLVMHLAAHSDVRGGELRPELDFKQNAVGTFNLLEFMRKKKLKNLIFSSTSAVYGEATVIPTPENYGPCRPISTYGATKLADEALIFAYSYYYDIKSTIFRFANVVGKNSTHGVIFDFLNMLHKNNEQLNILGDGTQSKSYIHVSDCVSAMLFLNKKMKDTDIFNLSNSTVTSVKTIADIAVRKLRLSDVKYTFSGGYNGSGWIGDVKFSHLDPKKSVNYGWKNKFSSDEAVERATEEMVNQLNLC